MKKAIIVAASMIVAVGTAADVVAQVGSEWVEALGAVGIIIWFA